MGLGPLVGANTSSLWRLDEASGTAVADAASNAPLTITGSPTVLAFKCGNARTFSGSAQYASGASTAGQKAALIAGDFSFSFWARPTSLAANRTVISHSGANDETAANNILFRVRLLTTGAIEAMWENGSGVDVTSVSSTATSEFQTLIAGILYHIGVNVAVNGANRDVTFYVNGQLHSTVTGKAPPDNGGSGQWYLARDGAVTTTDFAGQLDEIHFVTATRNASDFLAEFLRGAAEAIDTADLATSAVHAYSENSVGNALAGNVTAGVLEEHRLARLEPTRASRFNRGFNE
jgi:hypothetical protein